MRIEPEGYGLLGDVTCIAGAACLAARKGLEMLVADIDIGV
jgi:hypothetical protein